MAETGIKPRTVMMVAQRPSDFVEMRRCAVALAEFGWTAQMLYFCLGRAVAGEAEVYEEIERLRADGSLRDVELFDYQPATTERVRETGRRLMRDRMPAAIRPAYIRFSDAAHKLLQWIPTLLWLLREVRNSLFTVGKYLDNQRRIAAALDRMKPDAIVLPEDIVGAVTPLVIRAGHRRNTPSVILPYTIANQQEAFRSLAAQPNYQFRYWPNRIVGTLFPRWVMRQDGNALVRLPAPHILGQVATRTVPPDPWMMNSGYANVIAVENDAMHDYYRAAGIPGSKLEVVGAIYDDHLARYKLRREAERAALRDELGIASGKPLLVVGGCPDQSPNAPPGFEFADMADFCRRLGGALGALADDYELIVRPHPNYAPMGEILSEAGIRATTIDTARLVALADVYVAFASATIRWAIASAVPSVNYDVFHYDYDDYRGIAGVVNVARFADFESCLERLRPGRPELAELQAGIAGSSTRWGRLDGRATERIARLIDGMCRLDRVPRTSR